MAKQRKIPHTFVIIFALIIIAAVASWFVEGGEFTRTQKILPDGTSKTIIEPDSYQIVENQPQTWQIFSALFDGFVDKA